MPDTNLPRAFRGGIDALADGARALSRTLGDAGEVVFRERPTMEHVLLLFFLVAGAYMYHGANEFSSDAATFPRLTAGTTVVFSALLLARNYLPAPVRSIVAEPMQVLGEDDADRSSEERADDVEIDDAADSSGDATTETSSATYTYEIDDPRGPAVTSALCVVYVALTFTIGMLYATPIFVALYALWARMRWYETLALAGVSFGIAYAFFLVVSPEIAVGWYTGWRFPVPVLPELPISLAAVPDAVISA
ncbi:tripartite tricarboxylate transporter TctB family protein [Natronobacterium texcoconense]|uniref:Tripartite tricarboxylate transporter TctB family protein n=1 Tax=Natronobacterium texcoconense TaxID=1095778 RepID=A0A1H1GL38_NATTX|nr:tripartite tricarboxylate transporter TctB family protein [Natronobacterium texcoconense]SDR13813.1 Tripartite tricarboxylate transporter TctB family protein [Natronobacterium texcoconense]